MEYAGISDEPELLEGLIVCQTGEADMPRVLRNCIDFAGQMALQLGAIVYVDEHFTTDDAFLSRGKLRLDEPLPPSVFFLRATTTPEHVQIQANTVLVSCDRLASEATLFAQSGLADLLGDPARAPLIPRGDYGAGTAAYGVLAALSGLVAKLRRTGKTDSAKVDLTGVLSWVNWKAAASGCMGRDLKREGDAAEWPVLPCMDGHIALVFQPRDWPQIVAMVGDDRLAEERFASYKQRASHRDEYLDIISEWALTKSKAEIQQEFLSREIPAAPVMTPADLLEDELLQHREAFSKEQARGTPRLAHRIVARGATSNTQQRADGDLPLSGIRVLDLGIITAGAGVSALLADLGAEVLKIESHTYPDPFRAWAGEEVSPLFKCNNRSKYGIALDLKRAEEKAQFLELVESADVVVENFRRGVLERLGLGYEVLSRVNPDILLASISGQGLTGPGCGASSFGSTLEANSGFAVNVTYDDGMPYITGRNVNYPDQTVVMYAAAVVSMCLASSLRGHVDISQRDVAIYLLGEQLEQIAMGRSASTRDNGVSVRTRDEAWLAISDITRISSIEQRNVSDALDELEAQGVSAAPVLSGSEMFVQSVKNAPWLFDYSPNGDLVKGMPFQFVDDPMTIRLNSPQVGEHNSLWLGNAKVRET